MTDDVALSLEDLPDDAPDFDPCEEAGDGEVVAFGLLGPSQHPATWILAAFKKWGVKYRVVAGWETRGRPSGAFNPRGVLNHHTGSTSSASNPAGALRTVTVGRSDLAGPLCQVSTGYDGVTTIVAAGRANHAGRMKALGKLPAGDGNAQLIGNEIQTDGKQAMPREQYDAVVLVNAALLDAMGSSINELGLHATTSYEGKWDLGAGTGKSGAPFNLSKLRSDVAARLHAGPTAPASTEKDWFDMASIADLQKAAAVGVLSARLGSSVIETGKPLTLGIAVQRMYARSISDGANIAALTAAVQALAEAKGTDSQAILEAVRSAAEAGVDKAMADVSITLTAGGDTA